MLCGAHIARLMFDKRQAESLKSGYQTPMFVDFGDDIDSSTEYCNSVKTSSPDWEHIITNLALSLRPSDHFKLSAESHSSQYCNRELFALFKFDKFK